MCICDTASENKIPEGRAGIIETKSGFFMAFHFKNHKLENTAVTIKYCPYCGRKLLE